MCGRYYRRSDKQRIAEAFRIGIPPSFEILPDYNVAPQTLQPVIVEDRDTAETALHMMRWGLIPSWCDDPKTLGLTTINAQAESLMKKPLWREPFLRRRCLVPADGFYEWQKLDAKSKQPWAYALANGEPLAFAGLWQRWRSPDRTPDRPEEIETFSIVTTEANQLTAPAHNRMPVILEPRDYDRWLHPDDSSRPPLDLLRPLDAARMRGWKVSIAVGNVRNNKPALIEPVPDQPPRPTQPSLF
ncbi:MAG TPA: SOS response-associated peptidase [Acidobacteriaceae bacterium]|jgi:putative SOS response-associated peptidase YedK|nr:SOS response-associated peptidase [Acidobacteriaceae bacterium]